MSWPVSQYQVLRNTTKDRCVSHHWSQCSRHFVCMRNPFNQCLQNQWEDCTVVKLFIRFTHSQTVILSITWPEIFCKWNTKCRTTLITHFYMITTSALSCFDALAKEGKHTCIAHCFHSKLAIIPHSGSKVANDTASHSVTCITH